MSAPVLRKLSCNGFLKKHPAFSYAVLSFVAGALLVCAMPPYGFWPALFFSYSALYYSITRTDGLYQGFLAGWAFGFGFFLFGLNWIANALLVEGNEYAWAWPLAAAGLPVALAFFPAFACLAHKKLFPDRGAAALIAFAALISLSEWLRGTMFTGFPWNLTAYGWHNVLPVVQFVSIGGSYLLGLVTIFLAALPCYVLTGADGRRFKIVLALISALVGAAIYSYGYFRIQNEPGIIKNHALVVIQPNIPQEKKWEVWSSFDILVGTTREALRNVQAENITILWPETALTSRMLQQDKARLTLKNMLSGASGTVRLVTGILRVENGASDGKTYFNSIQAFDERLNVLWTYDKNHLVPFGEYLPLEEWLDMTPVAGFSGFQAGRARPAYELANQYVVPLVCYEVIFPGSVIKNIAKRPDLIINVSNDAWYGDSSGPRQHWVKGVFRSVEEGIPLARSANTGISGVIDSYGREIKRIPYGQRGFQLIEGVPKSLAKPTLYSRLDNRLYLNALIIITFIAVVFGSYKSSFR